MAKCREIITKAVVGKGRKRFRKKYSLNCCDKVSTILGCWVINHQFKGAEVGDKIRVSGSFDINVWYSYDKDSKTGVCNERVTYQQDVVLDTCEDGLCERKDIIVRSLREPNCCSVSIKDKKIVVDVENELGIEVICDQSLRVLVDESKCEEWQDLNHHNLGEDVMQEIDHKVQEKFIK